MKHTTHETVTQIDHAMSAGQRVVARDATGTLAARYFGSGCVLLGPWDARAAMWDIASDIRTPRQAQQFAANLIFVADGDMGRWSRGARGLLAQIIAGYRREGQRWSWSDLATAITRDLATDEDVADRDEQMAAVNLEYQLCWASVLAAVATREPRPLFSFRGWIAGRVRPDARLVLIGYTGQYDSAAEPLGTAMLSAATTAAAGDDNVIVLDDHPGSTLLRGDLAIDAAAVPSEVWWAAWHMYIGDE